jgi:hypothetical protein
MMSGITKRGQLAEDLLKQLTGYCEPIVEVKLVDAENTGTKTINQVRAVKSCVPLVVYHDPAKQWYVIPPMKVLELVEHRKG